MHTSLFVKNNQINLKALHAGTLTKSYCLLIYKLNELTLF